MASFVFLLVLLVPQSIDTFVLSAALGIAGLPKRQQLRTSLILAAFEGGMPIIGVLIGRGLGDAFGSIAGYVAGAVIGVAGLLMLQPGEEQAEEKKVQLLEKTKGWSIISLGLAISIDSLAIGLTLGLIKVPLWAVVVFMAGLAFVASRIGLRVGTKLGERMRENAEKFAGVILVVVAVLIIILKVTGHHL